MQGAVRLYQQKGRAAIYPFFEGAPSAKYGGRQGKNPSRTHPRAPSSEKRNLGGAGDHTTTSRAKGSMNRDYHREI